MQQNINFGAGPDDVNSDSIRTAFAKVQNNFTELYKTSTLSGVTELIAGVGLTQDSTTGRVNVFANINQVRLQSSTLNVGVNGSTNSNSAVLTRGQDIIFVDIGNTITTNLIENAKFAVSASAQPNITSVGTLNSLQTLGTVTVQSTATNSITTAGGAYFDKDIVANMATFTKSIINANGTDNALTITQTGNGNILLIRDEASDTSPLLINSDGQLLLGRTTTRSDLKLDVSGNIRIGDTVFVSSTVTVSSSSPVVLISVPASTYRTARHTIQITQGSNYQTADILAIHNGAVVQQTEYAVVSTAGDLGSISHAIANGNIQMSITMTSSQSATIRLATQLIQG